MNSHIINIFYFHLLLKLTFIINKSVKIQKTNKNIKIKTTLYFNNIKLYKMYFFKIKLINNFIFMTPINESLIIC